MKRSGALWGAFLIFVGLVWILGSTKIVSVDIIGSVMTLWPVFIIAGGLTLFLKREAHLPRVIIWVAVFALIFGYGVYLGNSQTGGLAADQTFEMKSDIKSAALEVNLGGARFDISSGGSQDLAKVSTNVRELRYDLTEGSSPRIKYSQMLKFKGFTGRQAFRAALSNSVPWNIELNTGAASGLLDFSDFALESCTINTGACDMDIVAGNKLDEARIIINGGAVNLKVSIPEDVGLKITSSSALTNVNGSASMLKSGRVYLSQNFDSAPNKVYLEVSSGVSNISVNR